MERLHSLRANAGQKDLQNDPPIVNSDARSGPRYISDQQNRSVIDEINLRESSATEVASIVVRTAIAIGLPESGRVPWYRGKQSVQQRKENRIWGEN